MDFGSFGTISFPLGLENLEKRGEHFPVRKRQGSFTQNTGKIRTNYIRKKLLEQLGKFSASNTENNANMVPYSKKKPRTLQILEKCEKYWKRQGNLSV